MRRWENGKEKQEKETMLLREIQEMFVVGEMS